MLTAEAPSYATIMELDRKVREFPVPPFDEGAPDDVGANLRGGGVRNRGDAWRCSEPW